MPRYLIAFPVYNAFFETDGLLFKVVDVTFMSKTSLSKEISYLNRNNSHGSLDPQDKSFSLFLVMCGEICNFAG